MINWLVEILLTEKLESSVVLMNDGEVLVKFNGSIYARIVNFYRKEE